MRCAPLLPRPPAGLGAVSHLARRVARGFASLSRRSAFLNFSSERGWRTICRLPSNADAAVHWNTAAGSLGSSTSIDTASTARGEAGPLADSLTTSSMSLQVPTAPGELIEPLEGTWV
jgi:hypothetical protein